MTRPSQRETLLTYWSGRTGKSRCPKQHVPTVRHDDGRANRRDGNDRVSSTHAPPQVAIDQGRKIAQRDGVERLIHGRDGRIRERNSYGHDSHPPKGGAQHRTHAAVR